MKKVWQIKPKASEKLPKVLDKSDTILWQLFYNRGIKKNKDIEKFLKPSYDSLYDPFLFKDMKKTVKRLNQAILKKEKIMIYGDYDADGVCGSLILFEALQKLGAKHIDVYLPHRQKEGYGLNMKVVEYFIKQQVNLLITVDCGTRDIKEIKKLQSQNIDTIIIDHHTAPDKKPDCFAFINPKYKKSGYPFQHLSAGGTVFKVVQALTILQDKSCLLVLGWEKWLLDLVAISTVADMMPLIDENRILVKWGLVVLNKTHRLGLKALLKAAGLMSKNNQEKVITQASPIVPITKFSSSLKIKEIGTYEIGFIIGPRINAAGRLDHANVAFKLLQAKDKLLAEKLARDLNQTNKERQEITAMITEEVMSQAEKQIKQAHKIIIALAPKDAYWPLGIIGLVAGRICEYFHKPTLVIGKTPTGFAGSGRSISKFNIIKALSKSSKYFSQFGGHPAACGFTIKNKEIIPEFVKKMHDIVDKELKDKDLQPRISIDMKIKLKDLTQDIYQQIKKIEPYGQGNPGPVFLASDLIIQDFKTIGSENKHLRLELKEGSIIFKAIAFSQGKKAEELKNNDKIDIVFEVEENDWQGRKTLELKIVDMRLQPC